jgi:hypothetical protein
MACRTPRKLQQCCACEPAAKLVILVDPFAPEEGVMYR